MDGMLQTNPIFADFLNAQNEELMREDEEDYEYMSLHNTYDHSS
jgi:hypothetical protein